jgi:hypothetical protein
MVVDDWLRNEATSAWFVIWGCAGMLMAVSLYILTDVFVVLAHRLLNPYVLMALAPAMILGLAEPTSIGSTLLLLGMILGTNFVLYGFLGLLVCAVWSLFRPRTTGP